MTLDTQAFELRTAAGRVHLGNREYQIIELLMRGRGQRITAEEAQAKILTYRGQGYALEV